MEEIPRVCLLLSRTSSGSLSIQNPPLRRSIRNWSELGDSWRWSPPTHLNGRLHHWFRFIRGLVRLQNRLIAWFDKGVGWTIINRRGIRMQQTQDDWIECPWGAFGGIKLITMLDRMGARRVIWYFIEEKEWWIQKDKRINFILLWGLVIWWKMINMNHN